MTETSPYHCGDRDHRYIHNREPDDPALGHGPVRRQSVVRVSIERHQQLDANADIFLEDAAGKPRGKSERSGTSNEILTKTRLEGTYYIRVEAQETGENRYSLRYGVEEPNPDKVAEEREKAAQGSPKNSAPVPVSSTILNFAVCMAPIFAPAAARKSSALGVGVGVGVGAGVAVAVGAGAGVGVDSSAHAAAMNREATINTVIDNPRIGAMDTLMSYLLHPMSGWKAAISRGAEPTCKLTRRLHSYRRRFYVSCYAASRSGSAVLGSILTRGYARNCGASDSGHMSLLEGSFALSLLVQITNANCAFQPYQRHSNQIQY